MRANTIPNADPKPKTPAKSTQPLYTIDQIAERWSSSPSSVRRALVENKTRVLDFGHDGKRGKQLVTEENLLKLEAKLSQVRK